jgi:hypothetical protein
MRVLFLKAEQSVPLADNPFAEWDVVVPVMPKAALLLAELGYSKFQLPIDYIDRARRNAIWQAAIDLSKNWHSQTEIPRYKTIDLLEVCRLEMLGFFQDVLTANAFADSFFAQHAPSEIAFTHYPQKPSTGKSTHDGTADIFEAVLLHRAKLLCITTRQVASQRFNPIQTAPATTEPNNAVSVSSQVTPKQIPKPVSKKRSLWKRIVGRMLRLRHQPQKQMEPNSERQHLTRIFESDLQNKKKLFIGYGAGYDLLMMWPYIKSIANENQGRALLVNICDDLPKKTLRSGLELDPCFEFIYQNDISLPVDDEYEQIMALFRREESLFVNLSYPLDNPQLSMQFEHLQRVLLPEATTAARIAHVFMTKHNVALYLDDWCAGVPTRAWAAIGNTLGIPTVNVPHGATSLVEFHSFISKYAFAWGELGRQNIATAAPDKQAQIFVTGDPSLEKIRITHRLHPTSNKILLLTGGCLHQVWTDLEMSSFVKCWEELLKLPKSFPNLEFVIKTHPSYRDFAPWYKHIAAKIPHTNLKVVDDQKLEDIAAGAVLSVIVGRPGTGGVVTMLQSVPTIFLDNMLVRDVQGYEIWRDDFGIPKIAAVDELSDLLLSMQNSPKVFSEILKKNASFLEAYLSPYKPVSLPELIKP